MDGMRIVLAEIDPARNIPVRFKGMDYIRAGSVTRPLREEPERERALRRLFDHTPFVKRVINGSMSAETVLGLLDSRAYFRLLKLSVEHPPPAAAGSLAFDGLLQQTVTNDWSITNLGAILLAEDLRDFRHLHRKAVRVIQYPGKSSIETTREREFNRGYLVGFEQLMDYIDT